MFFIFFLVLQAFATDAPRVPFDSTVDQVFDIFFKHKITTIENGIVVLDQKFFETENYSLIFNSTSPQRSSLQSPRILLFGKGRKLRIGFNHRLGNDRNLEAIQWRDDKKEWELREIVFTKSGPKMSKPNPSICLTCHMEPKIQPNFNPVVKSLDSTLANGTTNYNEFFKKIDLEDRIFRLLQRPPSQL